MQNKIKISLGGVQAEIAVPAVMGILNVTPDSFFEDSRMFTEEAVAERVREIRDGGASMIDIGGYSSRPGAADVSPEEELRRVGIGVAAARQEAPELIISIDTFRASVARGIIEKYGPCIINDISAGELDSDIIGVAAEYGVPYIAMHMRGTPSDMQSHTDYGDIVAEVLGYLAQKVLALREAGVKDIILDPGFGFAKTTADNYELLAALGRICALGLPILVGLSRKSMIYKVLDTTPSDALAGTAALNWESLRKGAAILRVHDVAEAVDVVRLFEYYRPYSGGTFKSTINLTWRITK